jgi:hypothetical protein
VSLFAVGIGTGIFLPPNTSTLMATIPASARGVANGARSMLQNTGGLVGTAMALAIVTTPLDTAEKRAAYSGTLSRLPGRDLSSFADSYRVALLVLFALCVMAAVASSLPGAAPASRSMSPVTTTVGADAAAG